MANISLSKDDIDGIVYEIYEWLDNKVNYEDSAKIEDWLKGVKFRDDALVVNVKFRGLPDYNNLINPLAEKFNVPVEKVEEFTEEPEVNDYVWYYIYEHIMPDLEEQLSQIWGDKINLGAYGRMGGWWGIPIKDLQSNLFIIDKEKIYKAVEDYLKRPKLQEELEENYGKDFKDYHVIDYVTVKVGDEIEGNWENFVKVNPKLQQLFDKINEVVDYWDKTDAWAKLLEDEFEEWLEEHPGQKTESSKKINWLKN